MKILEENTKLIMDFLGFVYYEPMVLIENGYGMNEWEEVYSKTPILVDRFDEDNDNKQIYFSEVPNPDFGKSAEEKPYWSTSLETLSWASLNRYWTKSRFGEYYSDWNGVMKLVEAVENTFIDSCNFRVVIGTTVVSIWNEDPKIERRVLGGEGATKIECTLECIVEFIKWYNKQPK